MGEIGRDLYVGGEGVSGLVLVLSIGLDRWSGRMSHAHSVSTARIKERARLFTAGPTYTDGIDDIVKAQLGDEWVELQEER